MRLLRYRRATERPSVRATYRLECRDELRREDLFERKPARNVKTLNHNEDNGLVGGPEIAGDQDFFDKTEDLVDGEEEDEGGLGEF